MLVRMISYSPQRVAIKHVPGTAVGPIPAAAHAREHFLEEQHALARGGVAHRGRFAFAEMEEGQIAFELRLAKTFEIVWSRERRWKVWTLALLHGDLWAGNRLIDAHGRNWLIDPAVHWGHREVDLAVVGDRAWIERYAEGSPGAALVAFKHDVCRWARDLAAPLDEISNGRLVGGLSDRMAELIGECAERVVKENERASKEAANRLGTRLLFGVLGQRVRDGIAESVRSGAIDEAERWGVMADVLADADEQIRRNLNLKQVLALLVARWVATCERGAAAGARG